MKIAVIGAGYVGGAVARLFENHDVVFYDPPKGFTDKEAVNDCAIGIVCVPTPQAEDGEADTLYVEDTIAWLETPLILIKSTVPPGTTNRLSVKWPKKRIAFSPEYVGEGNYFVPFWKYAHPTDMKYHDFMVIGGAIEVTSKIIDIFQAVKGPSVFYYQVSSVEAELVKYMENCWCAIKVIFANEFYDMAKIWGADYHKVREGFCLDKRFEKMHTLVFPDKRGYGGKCIPKDTMAFLKAAEKMGYTFKVLKAAIEKNNEYTSHSI